VISPGGSNSNIVRDIKEAGDEDIKLTGFFEFSCIFLVAILEIFVKNELLIDEK